jgi:DNA-binding NarL/FixJ family response regulator
VLQLIAEGHSSKKIAALLGLSVNTIRAHRNSVMSKLNIHQLAPLVHYAIKSGIAQL